MNEAALLLEDINPSRSRNILEYILVRGGATANEVAAQFNCRVDQVQCAIRTMRFWGISIISENWVYKVDNESAKRRLTTFRDMEFRMNMNKLYNVLKYTQSHQIYSLGIWLGEKEKPVALTDIMSHFDLTKRQSQNLISSLRRIGIDVMCQGGMYKIIGFTEVKSVKKKVEVKIDKTNKLLNEVFA